MEDWENRRLIAVMHACHCLWGSVSHHTNPQIGSSKRVIGGGVEGWRSGMEGGDWMKSGKGSKVNG